MKAFENQLSDIAIKQGISVEKLVQLTKENEHILAQQKVSSLYCIVPSCGSSYINNTDMVFRFHSIVQANLKVSFSTTC